MFSDLSETVKCHLSCKMALAHSHFSAKSEGIKHAVHTVRFYWGRCVHSVFIDDFSVKLFVFLIYIYI